MLENKFIYLIVNEEMSICDTFTRLSNVKQSMYEHGLTLNVPESCVSQISSKSGYEIIKIVSPRYRPPLPSRNIFGTILC